MLNRRSFLKNLAASIALGITGAPLLAKSIVPSVEEEPKQRVIAFYWSEDKGFGEGESFETVQEWKRSFEGTEWGSESANSIAIPYGELA